LLGGNDFLRKVPQAQTQQNLAKLIEAIQARGAIVLLLGVRGGLLHDPFAPTYASLAKQYHTAYVSDVLSGLWGRQDLMADEVHPNDAGYAIIAQRIAPVLSPLLR
jgi:acyl-CoA thioesterase-1